MEIGRRRWRPLPVFPCCVPLFEKIFRTGNTFLPSPALQHSSSLHSIFSKWPVENHNPNQLISNLQVPAVCNVHIYMCMCMHVYVHMYIYIYICTCICMHICVYTCIYVHINRVLVGGVSELQIPQTGLHTRNPLMQRAATDMRTPANNSTKQLYFLRPCNN